MESLTQDLVKSILFYDPDTGKFTWIKHTMGWLVGREAGCDSSGYIKLTIFRENYLAHRLAFFYTLGYWPKDHVDHINGIKNDNRWCNLREATPAQNMVNRTATKRSSLGVKGVTYRAGLKNYQVNLSLGSYKTLEEAKEVYEKAAKVLHGDFYKA